MAQDTKKWLKVLFAIAMAAPILTAIFATGGPFQQLNEVVTGERIVTIGQTSRTVNQQQPGRCEESEENAFQIPPPSRGSRLNK